MRAQQTSRITTADGHSFDWLDTGKKFVQAELDAIDAAQSSIRFEHYIFRASPVGERFRDAFTAAARRGVKVLLLLDAVGCWTLPRNYFHELQLLGGKVIWFNPVHWRFWSFRDHRKLLITDDTHAFLGGCNVAPEYAGDGVHEGWRDGGIALTGPVVAHLMESFASQVDIAGNQIWRVRRRARNGWVKAGQDVSLLLTRPGLQRGVLPRALQRDLAHAQDVSITTAYFLPVGGIKRMLLRAARVAQSFRLLLPGKSDVPLMQLATRALYARFFRRGARIYEYQPQVLHAKIFIIDDIVYIGSANLDPRSLAINFEIMLRIDSAPLAQQARASFERDLTHNHHVRPLSWREPAHGWQGLKQWLARLLFTRLDLAVAQFMVQKKERHPATHAVVK